MRASGRILIRAIAAIGLSAVALMATAQAQEPTKLNILVSNERATSEYPIFVAAELGFYEDEGLDVTFLPSATTVPYLAFLSNSDAELVMLDPAQMLQAVDNGQPVSLIYEYMQLAPEALVVPASSDIRSIADLKGKTIGMASDRDLVTVNIALDTVDMTADDVNAVVIGDSVPLIVAQMRDGKIDAYAGGSNETAGFESNGIALRHLTPPAISQAPGNSMVIWNPRKEELRPAITGFLRAWTRLRRRPCWTFRRSPAWRRSSFPSNGKTRNRECRSSGNPPMNCSCSGPGSAASRNPMSGRICRAPI